MRIGVVGATGYTGAGVLAALAGRPGSEVTVVTSRGEAGRPLVELLPSLAGVPGYRGLTLTDPAGLESQRERDPGRFPEVFFLAVSHRASMALAPRVLALGARVIDLTGDFRLKSARQYPVWYKAEHESPGLLAEAVYGLPELHREEIRRARLVANPGCYPTSVILALAPLAERSLLGPGSPVIVDSKSGVSGAGKALAESSLFTEVAENLHPYKVVGHPHTPEMIQELTLLGGKPLRLAFTPHLAPMSRGIESTVYLDAEGLPPYAEIRRLYEGRYAAERFVRVRPEGALPGTLDVRGTNFCDIALYLDEGAGILKIVSVIDNLARGASVQAVVNLNLLAGEDEGLGIPLAALRP
ncbi:MAG: N-acetyl-gamma-glutamyl-phosphate reductase [Deltaproteobacteria bacterium]|jgi:N-acetyl-gamma-glutamyl-phosphate reductase|nr:N-acetyl-gamma-glutamyl-phosphate reductase [Deltaproteobacteria bacterium]